MCWLDSYGFICSAVVLMGMTMLMELGKVLEYIEVWARMT